MDKVRSNIARCKAYYIMLLLPVCYFLLFCYVPMGAWRLHSKNIMPIEESWPPNGSALPILKNS